MGRQIEVTQFSAVEFEAWLKASPRPEMKPIRTKAFEEFEKQKLFNDKVVRVRVLRDSEDTEMKVLTFSIEKKFGPPAKTEPKPVEQKPKNLPPKVLKPQSLLISNIRVRVLSELTKIAGTLSELPPFRSRVEKIALDVADRDLTDILATAPIRQEIMRLLQDIEWKDGQEDPETTAKVVAWSGLDLVNGILACSTRIDPTLDKEELKQLYNRVFKPAPQFKQAQPPKRGPINLAPLQKIAPSPT